jgi:hypothetical protein
MVGKITTQGARFVKLGREARTRRADGGGSSSVGSDPLEVRDHGVGDVPFRLVAED